MRLAAALASLLLLTTAARPASPLDEYWAARDKGIVALKALEDAKATDAKVQAADKAALAGLQSGLSPSSGR